jgi:ABC-type Fe3+/spermidine/putrescine transport system ATPase subunit
MATSDRIAVLNRGRLVQVGPPAEIFDRPKTRFVAEFVGKANILSGRLDGDSHLILTDGVKIRLADAGALLPSSQVSVCLRPHNIKLVAGQDATRQLTDQGYNLFPGIVRRSIYFGDAVDYTVELASQSVLHVIAPPSQRFEPGQSICAAAHPENCVVVRED